MSTTLIDPFGNVFLFSFIKIGSKFFSCQDIPKIKVCNNYQHLPWHHRQGVSSLVSVGMISMFT